jgi:hypothetical protein
MRISHQGDPIHPYIREKEQIEACISDVRNWMVSHLLKFNEGKTVILHLNSKFRKVPDFPPLVIGNDVVSLSETAKNIGVVFDSLVTCEAHINALVKAAWFSLRKIGKIRNYLTQTAAKTLVHAFVTTRLDYCNSLLFGLPNHQIRKLQKIQNTAARIVTRSKRFDHITPVLSSLHWLTVEYRIQFKILVISYKAIHRLAPEYLRDLISLQSVSARNKSLRSASADKLLLMEVRSRSVTYGDRAFAVAAPKIWNALPLEIRQAPSLTSFKTKLKTHFYKMAFNI